MVDKHQKHTTLTALRRHTVFLAICTVAMLIGTVAQAEVLTFQDNITCNGGQPCSNGATIDQTYGDIVGQLDVVYAGRAVAGPGPVQNSPVWWDTGYGDLVKVAWGATSVAEIALIPQPGFQVTLNSFDLASWLSASNSTQYTIYDGRYNVLLSSGEITVSGMMHTHVPVHLTDAQGLIIQWGPTSSNVGIDNIDFTVTRTTIRTTGELQLAYTTIKTVTADATAPALITLPTCPNQEAVFSPTTLTCRAARCTMEASVMSEVSDITPGADSIRFYFSVDGATLGVFPTSNFGVHSTAKTRRIEVATASWMRPAVTRGAHTLEVKGCVADTTAGGGARAFAGDRMLTMRVHKMP